MNEAISPMPDGVRVRVKVVPGASRSEVVGLAGDRLKVRVAAPPEHGRANEAMIELLARALGVRARDIEVEAGHSSPRKTVRVRGVSEADAGRALGAR